MTNIKKVEYAFKTITQSSLESVNENAETSFYAYIYNRKIKLITLSELILFPEELLLEILITCWSYYEEALKGELNWKEKMLKKFNSGIDRISK